MRADALRQSPLDNYHNILTVLALHNYPALFEFLALADRRRACLHVVKSVVDDGVRLPSAEHVEALLQLVSPLIVDQTDAAAEHGDDDDDPQGFAEEQNLVGSLVHLFRAPGSPETEFNILVIVRKYFGMVRFMGGGGRGPHGRRCSLIAR